MGVEGQMAQQCAMGRKEGSEEGREGGRNGGRREGKKGEGERERKEREKTWCFPIILFFSTRYRTSLIN